MNIHEALKWSDDYAFKSAQARDQFECMTTLAQEVREMRRVFSDLASLCLNTSHVDADCIEALIQDYIEKTPDNSLAP